jgi:hypothetical protein
VPQTTTLPRALQAYIKRNLTTKERKKIKSNKSKKWWNKKIEELSKEKNG